MQDFIQDDELELKALEEKKRKMAEEAAERAQRGRCIKTCCYVIGAGAFGVFLRWLQVQTAFTEDGLAEKSVFHFFVPLFVIACAIVFARLLKNLRQNKFFLPEGFRGALSNEGRLFLILRWVIGGIMCIGALMLYGASETDKNTSMLRILALFAFLSGLSFPLLLSAANRSGKPRFCRLYASAPVIMFCIWLIVCYQNNAINSVGWSYIMELAAIIVALLAFFRTAGFAFGVPDTRRSIHYSMLGGSMCIMALADDRHMGMQIMFLAAALMLALYSVIMTNNLRQPENEEPEPQPQDGFERL